MESSDVQSIRGNIRPALKSFTEKQRAAKLADGPAAASSASTNSSDGDTLDEHDDGTTASSSSAAVKRSRPAVHDGDTLDEPDVQRVCYDAEILRDNARRALKSFAEKQRAAKLTGGSADASTPGPDVYEGLPCSKESIENLSRCSDPKDHAVYLRHLSDVLDPSSSTLSKVSYAAARNKTGRKARSEASPLVESVFEKYRTAAAGVANDEHNPFVLIGDHFEEMSEIDQEQFLLALEADADNISALLKQLLPGNMCKHKRYRIKQRYLNGGRSKRWDARNPDLVKDFMHTHMRLDTLGQAKTVGFDANGVPIRHHPHLLSGSMEHIYQHEFVPSDEYVAHLALFPTKTIKLSLFKEHARCPCMVQPKK